MECLKAAKEAGVPIIAIASSGQDVVGDDVADGTPSKNINNVETNWVIWFQKADIFLGTLISGLEMSHSVLLRHLLRHVFSLEIEEDESTQEEGESSAEADHQKWAQLCFHNQAATAAGDDGLGSGEPGGGGKGGSKAIEGDVGRWEAGEVVVVVDGGG